MNKIKNEEISGERLVTAILNENSIEHLHRYAIASEFTNSKVVLDIASGEGYGSNIISKNATHVFGVDIDRAAVLAARNKYVKKNLEFLEGRADEIPLPNDSVDVVISFETLEHHDKHHEMLKEIKRVLRTDGCLILSSPDKKYFSDELSYSNKFHVKELYKDEFKDLVDKYFVNTVYYNQRFFSGSLVLLDQLAGKIKVYEGDYDSVEAIGEFQPLYNIVIASDNTPQAMQGNSFFVSDKVVEAIRLETSRLYTQSSTWKIGRFFIAPFALVKTMFGRDK